MQPKKLLIGAAVCFTLSGVTASADQVTIASWGGSYQAAQSKALFKPVAEALFIPSFYYQMTPKIPLNTRCSISISKNLSINGRTRSSDQLGIWSYNINP